MPLEKSNKIALAVIVFGVAIPATVILSLTSRQEKEAHNLAGIRDYKAGHYDAAISDLNEYLKGHPLTLREYVHSAGKSDYAEEYLGLALMKQNRYTEAADAFRVWAHCSNGTFGSYMLGTALLNDGKKDEAKAAFQEAIHEDQSKSRNISWEAQQMITKIDQSGGKQ